MLRGNRGASSKCSTVWCRRDPSQRWTASGLLESKLFAGVGLETLDPVASVQSLPSTLPTTLRQEQRSSVGIQDIASSSRIEDDGIAEVPETSGEHLMREAIPLRTIGSSNTIMTVDSSSTLTTEKAERGQENKQSSSGRLSCLIRNRRACTSFDVQIY